MQGFVISTLLIRSNPSQNLGSRQGNIYLLFTKEEVATLVNNLSQIIWLMGAELGFESILFKY